ncbi:MAG: hypothetical protein R3F46_15500 [bacterium]
MRFVGSGAARAAAALSILAICWMLPSCGGRAPAASGSQAALQPKPPSAPELPLNSLPDIAGLPEPVHAASYLGQGWYAVPILEQGVLLDSAGTVSLEADGIHIAAGDQAAWLLFAVQGFDGDSFPAALQSEVSAVSGDYHLATGNQLSGRWDFSEASSGDALFEYPAAAAGSDPGNHLSPHGIHYIALVANPGSTLTISGLQLAVDGGQQAPASVDFPFCYRSPLGVQINWNSSADSGNPDFAGYIVERAVWPGTAFSPISPLSPEQDWLDEAVQDGQHYRYRLQCRDLAGNASTGLYSTVLHTSDNLPPVCIIDLPSGPLYGAQQVEIDLSGSFDRDGDVFTDYFLRFGSGQLDSGIEPLTNGDGLFSLLLQPGCYRVIASAKAGSLSSSCTAELKVYPQWEQEAQLIAPAPPSAPVLSDPVSVHLPAIGGVASFGKEPLLPGLGLLLQPDDGEASLRRIVPPRFGIEGISEAVLWNGLAICAAVDGSNAWVAFTDGEEFNWLEGARGFAKGSGVDLVVPGSNVPHLFFIEENFMPVSRLLAYESFGSNTPLELVPFFEGEYPFDVEWNESQQSFDILYGQPGITRLRRCDIDGNLVLERTVSFSTPDMLDLEIDPLSGSPGILSRSGGSALYTQYDNITDIFLPTEQLDPLLLSSTGEDLAWVDGVPAVFLGSPGQPAGLYHRTGGSWQRMEADWAVDSGLDAALAVRPDGSLRVLDRDGSQQTWLVDIQPGSSQAVAGNLAPTGPQGKDLNAVAGTDGLHAIWCADGSSRHYRNPLDGSGWLPVNLLGDCDSQDLMADRGRDVHLSTRSGDASFLLEWNGADWDVLWFTLSNLQQTNPWMCMQSNSAPPQWFFLQDDSPGSSLHYVTNQGGMGLQDSQSSISPAKVMEGAAVISGNFPVSVVALGNGFSPDGRIGTLGQSRTEVEVLMTTSATAAIVDSGLSGRQLDACMGKHVDGSSLTVFYMADGTYQQEATRMIGFGSSGDFILYGTDHFRFPFGTREWQRLRSVSAAQAWGETCVGLIDQSFAAGAVLEWDDFGDWEELPLPPLDFAGSNLHELVVGNDGRWHLLYHDIDDGGIHVISTT